MFWREALFTVNQVLFPANYGCHRAGNFVNISWIIVLSNLFAKNLQALETRQQVKQLSRYVLALP
jgi:hypothetical protein